MCNTSIVQAHLGKVGCACLVPDTYPKQLEPFYKRSISECLLKEVNESRLPLFVKPATNDKAFDGMVMETMDDMPEGLGDAKVYVSEVVRFSGPEHRLFLGGGRLYAIGVRDTGVGSTSDANSVECKQLIQSIISALGDLYCAVDIRFIAQAGHERWAVVEVNPGFSLDDCGIGIEVYVNYCIDSCQWLRQQLKRRGVYGGERRETDVINNNEKKKSVGLPRQNT